MGRLCHGQNRPGQEAVLCARRVRHPHRRAVLLLSSRQVQAAKCIPHPRGEAAAVSAMATG
eukprot:3972786-Pyramimonas_sp.AAC.1